MPVVMQSVDELVHDVEKDMSVWQAQNRSLRGQIDHLQRLVKGLTKNVDKIEEECSTPPQIPLRHDPQIRLTLGNTKIMAFKWESLSLDEDDGEEVAEEANDGKAEKGTTVCPVHEDEGKQSSLSKF